MTATQTFEPGDRVLAGGGKAYIVNIGEQYALVHLLGGPHRGVRIDVPVGNLIKDES